MYMCDACAYILHSLTSCNEPKSFERKSWDERTNWAISHTTSMISSFSTTQENVGSFGWCCNDCRAIHMQGRNGSLQYSLARCCCQGKYVNIGWFDTSKLTKTQVVKPEALTPLLYAACLVDDKATNLLWKDSDRSISRIAIPWNRFSGVRNTSWWRPSFARCRAWTFMNWISPRIQHWYLWAETMPSDRSSERPVGLQL